MNSSLTNVIVSLVENKMGFRGAFAPTVPICGPSALDTAEVFG